MCRKQSRTVKEKAIQIFNERSSLWSTSKLKWLTEI